MRRIFAVLFTVILCLIASCAFAGGILTLPSSLKEVQANAFFGNQSLGVVVLPEGVETIG